MGRKEFNISMERLEDWNVLIESQKRASKGLSGLG